MPLEHHNAFILAKIVPSAIVPPIGRSWACPSQRSRRLYNSKPVYFIGDGDNYLLGFTGATEAQNPCVAALPFSLAQLLACRQQRTGSHFGHHRAS